MKEGRKPEYPEKTPDDKLQKCHKPSNSNLKRDLNPHSSIGDRQRKQMC